MNEDRRTRDRFERFPTKSSFARSLLLAEVVGGGCAQCQDHSSFRTEWEGRISGRPRGKSPRRTAKLCGGIYQRPDTNQPGFVYKTKLGRVAGARRRSPE